MNNILNFGRFLKTYRVCFGCLKIDYMVFECRLANLPTRNFVRVGNTQKGNFVAFQTFTENKFDTSLVLWLAFWSVRNKQPNL
jgi:hypothetical protein